MEPKQPKKREDEHQPPRGTKKEHADEIPDEKPVGEDGASVDGFK